VSINRTDTNDPTLATLDANITRVLYRRRARRGDAVVPDGDLAGGDLAGFARGAVRANDEPHPDHGDARVSAPTGGQGDEDAADHGNGSTGCRLRLARDVRGDLVANNISEQLASAVKKGDLLDAELGWRKVVSVKPTREKYEPSGSTWLLFVVLVDGVEVEVRHPEDERVRTIDEYIEIEPDESGYHERLEAAFAEDSSLLNDEQHEHLKMLRRRYGKNSGA
jgi:hypothetical protein